MHPKRNMDAAVPHISIARKLGWFGLRLFAILAIVFLAIQLAPGGPVARFFFALYEKALMDAGASGPIR